MIGLGKWQFDVNTIVFKGKITIDVFDNNGKYGFNAEVPGMKDTTNYFISEIKEEGNTLKVKGGSELLPGKTVEVVATFNGNTCEGYVVAPFFGKIPIKNGVKIG